MQEFTLDIVLAPSYDKNATMARDVRKRRKDPLAVALGRRGGKARAARLTADERRRIALMGVQARRAKLQARKKFQKSVGES